MFRSALAPTVVACTLSLLASPAPAQPSEPPPPPQYDPYAGQPMAPDTPAPASNTPQRTSWFAGIGLAAAGLSFERDSSSWGGGRANGYFGGMLTRHYAAVIEVSLGSYESEEIYYDFANPATLRLEVAIITVGAQVFLGDSLWLRAGIGSTRARLGDNYGVDFGDARGRAFTVAGGYELLQRPGFAWDLNLGVTSTGFSGSVDNEAMVAHIGFGFSAY